MRIKINNIENVDTFFSILDGCKGKIELVSQEGDKINLRSKLSQYVSMAKIFSDGYIKQLELEVEDSDDFCRLFKYMYEGK
jgi:hypothetical protein